MGHGGVGGETCWVVFWNWHTGGGAGDDGLDGVAVFGASWHGVCPDWLLLAVAPEYGGGPWGVSVGGGLLGGGGWDEGCVGVGEERGGASGEVFY